MTEFPTDYPSDGGGLATYPLVIGVVVLALGALLFFGGLIFGRIIAENDQKDRRKRTAEHIYKTILKEVVLARQQVRHGVIDGVRRVREQIRTQLGPVLGLHDSMKDVLKALADSETAPKPKKDSPEPDKSGHYEKVKIEDGVVIDPGTPGAVLQSFGNNLLFPGTAPKLDRVKMVTVEKGEPAKPAEEKLETRDEMEFRARKALDGFFIYWSEKDLRMAELLAAGDALDRRELQDKSKDKTPAVAPISEYPEISAVFDGK